MYETSYDAVRRAGHQLVAKRNDFIQEARYSLSGIENRILLYMFSKVKPADPEDTVYEYSFSELFAVMGYKTDSYTEIKRLIQKMNALSFWRDAENEDEDDELITFFDSDSVTANQKKGVFHAAFSKKIRPYIFNLQIQKDQDGRYYTTYALQYVVLMKHYYSQRLYELLKSYQYNNQKWEFELGTGGKHDLYRRLAAVDMESKKPIVPDSWRNFAVFERDVLKPAKSDIDQLSDIKIRYAVSKLDLSGKRHRRYVRITFAMAQKTDGELKKTESYIDRQYYDLRLKEMNDQFHQMELEEFLEDQQKKQDDEVTEDSARHAIEKAEQLNARTKKSRTPILTSVIGEWFSDEQIESLYRLAVKKIPDGEVDAEHYDMWACNYLKHYLDRILATPGDTRKSVFNRLLDMTDKDYDGFAQQVANQYPMYHHTLQDYIGEYKKIRSGNNGPIQDL